jgi:hypothetical protein
LDAERAEFGVIRSPELSNAIQESLGSGRSCLPGRLRPAGVAADFLVLHPALLETGFPARLLQFIAERVGIKCDDPLVLALGDWNPSEPVLPLLELPVPVLKILARPAPRTPLDSPLMAWLTAVRRWCRRNARIGLATLVCRPGSVTVTRTYLDLLFNLVDSDPRVRRMALDVDPGWVPWLGCVVQFHYLERHELGD